jgi:hypothetical protein
VVRVGIVEEQGELPLVQLPLQRGSLRPDLVGQLLVLVGQRGEVDEVARSPLQLLPAADLLPVLGRLPGPPSGQLGVVPDAGLGQAPV